MCVCRILWDQNKTKTYETCPHGLANGLIPGLPAILGPPLAIDCCIACLLSSHAFSARISWTIFSRLPCLTSFMLTLPVLTSLSSRKSKSLNNPSSLSSFGPEGKAESGTGGLEGLPRIDSANRRRARPPQRGPLGSVIWSFLGKCEFAHAISCASEFTFCTISFNPCQPIDYVDNLQSRR